MRSVLEVTSPFGPVGNHPAGLLSPSPLSDTFRSEPSGPAHGRARPDPPGAGEMTDGP